MQYNNGLQKILTTKDVTLRVDHRLYRGPQPDLETLKTLKSIGLEYVYNLRNEDFRPSEALCRQLGLHHFRIPVTDHAVPSLKYVQRFIKLVMAQPVGKFGIVHCLAGQGRTGVFVACYRIACGMNPTEAVNITVNEGGPMTPNQKDWVLRRFFYPTQS